MKKTLIALAVVVLALPVIARHITHRLSFADAQASPWGKERLDGSVKFYLKGQATPKVLETMREGVAKQSRPINPEQPELVGCQASAVDAMYNFQRHAKKLGANAVIEIVSYYDGVTGVSATEYECHAGSLNAGVTLKGTYAKVAD